MVRQFGRLVALAVNLLFFTIARPVAGLICLALQACLIGWLPAAICAVYALSQYSTDQKIAAFRAEQLR